MEYMEYMYTLMDCESIGTHGVSFKNLSVARDYAFKLRELGLCNHFRIGAYRKDQKGWVPLYESDNGIRTFPKPKSPYSW